MGRWGILSASVPTVRFILFSSLNISHLLLYIYSVKLLNCRDCPLDCKFTHCPCKDSAKTCKFTLTLAGTPLPEHPVDHEVSRANGIARGAIPARVWPNSSASFSGVQAASQRFAKWIAAFGLGPKKPQQLQPSITTKGHQPSHMPHQAARCSSY